jgi:hypothetical protein
MTARPAGPAGDRKPASRADALAGMPDEWIDCRATGHDDQTTGGYGVITLDARGHQTEQVAWSWMRRACRRCGRTVETFYDAFFRVASSPGPKYPAGYLIEGLGRGAPRQEARREWFARHVGPPPA